METKRTRRILRDLPVSFCIVASSSAGAGTVREDEVVTPRDLHLTHRTGLAVSLTSLASGMGKSFGRSLRGAGKREEDC